MFVVGGDGSDTDDTDELMVRVVWRVRVRRVCEIYTGLLLLPRECVDMPESTAPTKMMQERAMGERAKWAPKTLTDSGMSTPAVLNSSAVLTGACTCGKQR